MKRSQADGRPRRRPPEVPAEPTAPAREGQEAARQATFEAVVDRITAQGVYLLDPEGRVASWNKGAEAMQGLRAEEALGQPFARFFPLEDRHSGAPERLLETAAREGRAESQGWRLRKDGSRVWVSSTLHGLRGPDGSLTGFLKITRDLTAQRAADEALLESERRFRYLVEGVVDYAIYMLDRNGLITNWNRGAERIKGYAADEVVGRHFGVFYPPEDRAAGAPAHALATALREGRFVGEGWRVRKDGARFWASVVIDPIHDDHGVHIGFAKITRDVTDRREAEEALRESERQFRLLVSGVTDYAIYMLDPNGLITSWNAGAEKIKGYTAEEVVGRHVTQFYTPEDRAAGLALKGLMTAAAEGRFESEGWRVRKDGSRFWANVVIDAIRDETGALLGFAKITRDVTERKQAEAELEAARRAMAQAQKMESLGKLTGGVAHDFNNLLMVISGQAQLIRNRLDQPERVQTALEAIEAAAERGAQLTGHLLTFARRQRLNTEVVSIAAELQRVQTLLAASLPPGITLELELADDVGAAELDAAEFELALINLGVNARDAMPHGGHLRIAARNVALAEPKGLEGAFIAIDVEDTGEGIAPDVAEQIFEPFFTTKGPGKGTGLGLSQVFGFARQAGGDVRVRSTLGVGACFSLYLPRSDAAPARRADADGAPPEAPAATILLVEDTRTWRRSRANCCASWGIG